MSATTVAVNLVPKVLRMQEARRRRTARWTLTALIAALLAGGTTLVTLDRQASAAELRAQQRSLQVSLTAVRGRLSDATETCRRLKSEIQRADALRSKRCWSGMLALLSRAMPAETWLTSISTEPPLPSGAGPVRALLPSGATQPTTAQPITLSAPTSLILRGYALDHDALYAFISALKQSRVFSKVELVGKAGAEPMLKTTAVRFELSCTW
ncbi:MAG TPA: PilN domain-containing protein [Phycisphaerae bacterium]|jgi:Tfp pilus assembly protein PilN